jgi:hypothetical protein
MPKERKTTDMPEMLAPPAADPRPRKEPHTTPVLLIDDIEDPVVPEEALEKPSTMPRVETSAPDKTQDTSQATNAESWVQHEALLHGFCQVLQQRHQEMQEGFSTWLRQTMSAADRVNDNVMTAWGKWIETQCKANEHAQYQLSDALAKIQEHGLGSLGAPYTVSIAVESPKGYPVTFTIAKQDQQTLFTEVVALFVWLQDNQCRVPQKG